MPSNARRAAWRFDALWAVPAQLVGSAAGPGRWKMSRRRGVRASCVRERGGKRSRGSEWARGRDSLEGDARKSRLGGTVSKEMLDSMDLSSKFPCHNSLRQFLCSIFSGTCPQISGRPCELCPWAKVTEFPLALLHDTKSASAKRRGNQRSQNTENLIIEYKWINSANGLWGQYVDFGVFHEWIWMNGKQRRAQWICKLLHQKEKNIR